MKKEQSLIDLEKDPRYEKNLSRQDRRRAGIKTRRGNPVPAMAKHMQNMAESIGLNYGGMRRSYTNTAKDGSRIPTKDILKGNEKIKLKAMIKAERALNDRQKEKLLKKIENAKPNTVLLVHKEVNYVTVRGKTIRVTGKAICLTPSMFKQVMASH